MTFLAARKGIGPGRYSVLGNLALLYQKTYYPMGSCMQTSTSVNISDCTFPRSIGGAGDELLPAACSIEKHVWTFHSFQHSWEVLNYAQDRSRSWKVGHELPWTEYEKPPESFHRNEALTVSATEIPWEWLWFKSSSSDSPGSAIHVHPASTLSHTLKLGAERLPFCRSCDIILNDQLRLDLIA